MLDNANTTMSGTQASNCFSSTAEKIGMTFVYCLVFIVSLAGNTVIGIIVYKMKPMRKPINFFIVNMAMSDLLVPIIWIPWGIQKLYMHSWMIGGPLGQAFCKLVHFLKDVSVLVSIQSLVLIAVDRFGAVVFPLRSPLISSKLCPFFILATWIIAMASYSPYLFAFKLVDYQGGLACRLRWNEAFEEYLSIENYFASVLVVFCFMPLVIIAVLYIIIYLKLKSHKIPGEHSVNTGQQRLQRERNVLKMAIAIVVGFAVCFLPLGIAWFLSSFASSIRSCSFQYFFSVVVIMARANCATNPCICFLFSRSYREGLKNLLGIS